MFNPTTGKYEPGWRPAHGEGFQVVKQGLWENVVNPVSGENSLKTHTLKLVKEWCGNGKHQFDTEVPRDRQMTCIHCGQTITFVVGYHDLKDGFLVERQ